MLVRCVKMQLIKMVAGLIGSSSAFWKKRKRRLRRRKVGLSMTDSAWHDAKTDPPEYDKQVLVCLSTGLVTLGVLWKKWDWKLAVSIGRYHDGTEVRWWMPKPAPHSSTVPKEPE